MLGGFENVHAVDIEGSSTFIKAIMPPPLRSGARALDIGAGIGRVARTLLIPSGFGEVDLQDINESFLKRARDTIGSAVANTYCCGMDEFTFGDNGTRTWDLIWVQWCAIYLSDADFVKFFRRAGAALDNADSRVVLKENILKRDGPAEVDQSDASVTRSDAHLKRLFAEAGLEIIEQRVQDKMPAELYPIKFYALRPAP